MLPPPKCEVEGLINTKLLYSVEAVDLCQVRSVFCFPESNPKKRFVEYSSEFLAPALLR